MRKMSLRMAWMMLVLSVIGLLGGCALIPRDAEPVRIFYAYRNGSQWGGQFTAEVTRDEIVYAGFFEDGEYIELNHQPITSEQWENLCRAVEQLRGQVKPEGLMDSARKWIGEKLLGGKVDGTEEHELRILYGEKGELLWNEDPTDIARVLRDTVQNCWDAQRR